jgi:hypothetical protein
MISVAWLSKVLFLKQNHSILSALADSERPPAWQACFAMPEDRCKCSKPHDREKYGD